MVGFSPAAQADTIPAWTDEVGMRKLIAEGNDVAEPWEGLTSFYKVLSHHVWLQRTLLSPYWGLVNLSPFIQEPIGLNSEGAGTSHP